MDAQKQNLHNKININSADKDKLARIGGIGGTLADQLIKYRSEHGPLHSLDEVNQIEGFDKISAEKLKQKSFIGEIPKKNKR